jgi:hypothetical protein
MDVETQPSMPAFREVARRGADAKQKDDDAMLMEEGDQLMDSDEEVLADEAEITAAAWDPFDDTGHIPEGFQKLIRPRRLCAYSGSLFTVCLFSICQARMSRRTRPILRKSTQMKRMNFSRS